MREALGGDGYKSACNLFYMSKHIADMIDKSGTPVFSSKRAQGCPDSILKDINKTNGQFQL